MYLMPDAADITNLVKRWGQLSIHGLSGHKHTGSLSDPDIRKFRPDYRKSHS